MYSVPVLFIFFNRKDVAAEAFARIREVKPAKLYLAQDGPRASRGEAEAAKVRDAREAITSMVDWECELHTRFLPENMGCRLAVNSAISWLFENEEAGIIMEDDCVANPSFWPFMEEMLTRFKDDDRIGMVAGHNSQAPVDTEYSYVFSRYKACWGWATWRRAWANMDLDMTWRNSSQSRSILANIGYRNKDIRFWKYQIKTVDEKYVNTWDWQWCLSMAAQNQLSVAPAINLVTNIGFGEDATHTSIGFAEVGKTNDSDALLSFPLSHPVYVVPDDTLDRKLMRKNRTFYSFVIRLLPFGFKKWLKSRI